MVCKTSRSLCHAVLGWTDVRTCLQLSWFCGWSYKSFECCGLWPSNSNLFTEEDSAPSLWLNLQPLQTQLTASQRKWNKWEALFANEEAEYKRTQSLGETPHYFQHWEQVHRQRLQLSLLPRSDAFRSSRADNCRFSDAYHTRGHWKLLQAERVKTGVVFCALRKEMHEHPSDNDWLICEFCGMKTARVTAVVSCLCPRGATTVFISAYK